MSPAAPPTWSSARTALGRRPAASNHGATEASMSDSVAVVRDYLLNEWGNSIDRAELDGSRDLLDEGVIDSFGLMQLLEFLRERFGLEFTPNEMVANNFRTLASIGAFVDAKLESKT
jgi:acyl carrier protein